MADLTPSEVTVATRCPPENVVLVWPLVLDQLKARDAGGRNSQIAAAATIMVETGKFRPITENLNYGAEGLRKTWPSRFPSPSIALAYQRQPERIANYVYANRNGNGPEESGDGWLYRGRGLIQTTGRANYAAAQAALGFDLLAQPDLALDVEIAAEIFGWYWTTNSLNQAAELAKWEQIRHTVNGGQLGLEGYLGCIRRFGVAA